MSEEELMIEHNKMVIKILQQCDHILENRCYLNEIGIKNTVTEIKDIAKHFYIEEPQWRNNNMSEEEKKAIKTVKQYKKCFVFETVHEETGERLNEYSNTIDIVLNLIDKQQKEIEEFRGIKNGTTIIYKGKAKYVREDKINKYYISKDKIRELIENNEEDISYSLHDMIEDLKKLLEEK